MKPSLLIAAGALTLALAPQPTSAAPMLGANAGANVAASSALPLTEIHYRHGACRLGPRGWHRSYRWGRVACVPVRFLRRY